MADEMNITRFLEKLHKGRADWDALLAQIPEEQLTIPGASGAWTVKDVIAHITWHEREMIGMLKGRTLEHGSDLWLLPTEERNAAIYEQNTDRPPAEVMDDAPKVYQEMRDLVATLSDEELQYPFRFECMPDDWVPWKIIASNTYGHYEQHTLDIEAWVAKTTLPVSSARIDHIPVIWVAPQSTPLPSRLVIWLPYFTGTKEQMLPSLQQLAATGFVALSYDPWQHGERGSESAEQLVARVFGNFRRHMWPILGQTTIDALRVIDWAIENLGVLPSVRIGGISMGGDIAVAIAGLDTRVECVAAIAATPDWLRPGMTDPSQPGTLLPPGEADGYARFFYDQLNPITHLTSYAHCPAITFECGEMDTHVPPDGALRLQEAVKETYQARPERLRVNLHPDTGHDSSNPDMWQGCLEWFKRF